MKRYLVIYHASVSAAAQMATATPEQAREGMAAWMQWARKMAPAIVELGAPLGSTVSFAAPHVRGEVASSIAGYSVLQAENHDDLAAVLGGHPHFRAPGASIVVHEMLSLPGL